MKAVMVFTGLGAHPGDFPLSPPRVLSQDCAERDCQKPAEHGNYIPSESPASLVLGLRWSSYLWLWKCFPNKQLSMLYADISLQMGLFFSRIWMCLPPSAGWQGMSSCSQSYRAFLRKLLEGTPPRYHAEELSSVMHFRVMLWKDN